MITRCDAAIHDFMGWEGSATATATPLCEAGKFMRNEIGASMDDKFDTDSLSLHVFSIRCNLSLLGD
jgi:hypothetical protein